ncbi:MAG: nucleotide exchange factor GrpE [Ruminococcaceae bacterium]|nr:nucleotide exchange factor GrpE [Oscillospiraceae bacterium]
MEEIKKEFTEDTAEVEQTVQEEAQENVSEENTDGAEEQKSSKQEKKKIKKLESEIEKLSATVAELEAQIAEANDKYTRLFAEYDNYRKRSAKEREGIYTDAYVDAIGEILPILDNMERALQYKDNDSENIARGLEMIMKSFVDTLGKMGVSEIEALGAEFDPNLHNAVMHVDDEAYGENEIVEVFMKGYRKGDKVLRHSMVKVAN